MATIINNQNTGANSTVSGTPVTTPGVLPSILPTIGKLPDVLAVTGGSTTLTAVAGITTLELTNPAVIATYTLNLPATATNGQLFVVTSAAAGVGLVGVTALTLAGAAFSVGSPISLPAGRPLLLQVNSATNSYLVCQA